MLEQNMEPMVLSPAFLNLPRIDVTLVELSTRNLLTMPVYPQIGISPWSMTLDYPCNLNCICDFSLQIVTSVFFYLVGSLVRATPVMYLVHMYVQAEHVLEVKVLILKNIDI